MISCGCSASQGRASTAAWMPRSATHAAEAERAPDHEVAEEQQPHEPGRPAAPADERGEGHDQRHARGQHHRDDHQDPAEDEQGRLERHRSDGPGVAHVRGVGRSLPPPQGQPCGRGEGDEQPAQDRSIAARDAKVGGREHQAAKWKWPWMALLPVALTFGRPYGSPSRSKWSAFAANIGEPGIVEKMVSERTVGLPVAPMYGVELGVGGRADLEAALAAVDREDDRDALDRDDLADQPGEVGDGAAQRAGEDLEELGLLLVGRAVVDEDGRLPRAGQDVARDVDGQRDRPAADVDALDGPAVDMPGERGIAGPAVRVLPDPARAQHVAGADLEQLALDVVGHRSVLRGRRRDSVE